MASGAEFAQEVWLNHLCHLASGCTGRWATVPMIVTNGVK